MPTKVTCPHCEQALRLPEDLYYQPSQCPLCKGAFAVRWPRTEPAAAVVAPRAEEERRPCPRCGQSIMARAVKCRHCQQWLE